VKARRANYKMLTINVTQLRSCTMISIINFLSQPEYFVFSRMFCLERFSFLQLYVFTMRFDLKNNQLTYYSIVQPINNIVLSTTRDCFLGNVSI